MIDVLLFNCLQSKKARMKIIVRVDTQVPPITTHTRSGRDGNPPIKSHAPVRRDIAGLTTGVRIAEEDVAMITNVTNVREVTPQMPAIRIGHLRPRKQINGPFGGTSTPIDVEILSKLFSGIPHTASYVFSGGIH